MDTHFTNNVAPIRSTMRKEMESFIEKPKIRKKLARLGSRLPDSVINAYAPNLAKLNIPKKSKFSKNFSPPSASITNSQRLPLIDSQNSPKSIAKETIKGKNEILTALISNFIGDHASFSLKKRNMKNLKFFETKEEDSDRDNKFYEKNLENFRGKEMAEYQSDIVKNLKIEKIRLKSSKRIKQRLQSV